MNKLRRKKDMAVNLGEKESEYFQMLLSSEKTRSRQKLKQEWQILSGSYYNRGKKRPWYRADSKLHRPSASGDF